MGEKMKIKIFVIVVMMIMIGSTLITSANIYNIDNIKNSSNNNIVKIRVAIYTDEKEDAIFYGPYARTVYFVNALSDYCWKVGNTSYKIVTTLLSTKAILKGELKTKNFDVLIYPPDTADQDMFYTGFSRLPKNRIREKNIAEFINKGGGYFGTCGGAMIAGDMTNRPKTLVEKLWKNSCLEISDVDILFKTHAPLIGQLFGKSPESFGTFAYLFYSSWNQADMNANYHSGVCLDCPVNRDNPIFDDYLEPTRRIRWLGAPNFEIPEDTKGEISVIATFPDEEISENDTISIHQWKYVGGIRGLIKGLFYEGGELYWMENLGLSMKALLCAGDWKCDVIVKTNYSNKPFMVAEYYPNKNNARIVRCSGHPEHNVWWGGHIVNAADMDYNNMYEGFYKWVDIVPKNDTIEDEFAYNYWINRRSVVWVSKIVPDNDLPPIYGPSQVSDIYPYNQSSEFTIAGNAEVSGGIESLDLFYRYSSTNGTVEDPWCNWTIYSTDFDVSDGWSWEFNSTKTEGPGYYQFYSIRHVQVNEYEWLNETAPPGPDTIIYICG